MRTFISGLVLFLAAGALAIAHHGLAAFDQTTKITLKGTVTAFRFVNPHAVVEFDGEGRQRAAFKDGKRN